MDVGDAEDMHMNINVTVEGKLSGNHGHGGGRKSGAGSGSFETVIRNVGEGKICIKLGKGSTVQVINESTV